MPSNPHLLKFLDAQILDEGKAIDTYQELILEYGQWLTKLPDRERESHKGIQELIVTILQDETRHKGLLEKIKKAVEEAGR